MSDLKFNFDMKEQFFNSSEFNNQLKTFIFLVFFNLLLGKFS